MGEAVKHYPNPGQGVFSLETDMPLKLSGFTNDGRLLKKMDVDEHTTSLSLESLPKGVYILEWQGTSGTTTSRLVIE